MDAISTWNQTYNFQLPDEIWKVILEHLTLKEATQTVLVSKKWKMLVWESRKKLTTRYTHLTDNDFSRITQTWKNLQVLDLSGCSFLSSSLTGLSQLGNLQDLNLSMCRLTDEQTKYLFVHPLSNRLEYLNLSWCVIGDEGATSIAQCPRVQRLNISYCRNITDQGIRVLSEKLLLSLQHLDLRGLKVLTNQSLEDLSQFCTNLKTLSLYFCFPDLSDAEIKDIFTQNMRKVEIFRLAANPKYNIGGMLQLNHPEVQIQLEALQQIRKALSVEINPPIDDIIVAGAVPMLVKFLDFDESHPQATAFQIEAAWALTNISSGTSANTHVVIENGAIPKFVKLIERSKDENIQSQAVWGLGNIAGDSATSRDLVLEYNAIPPMLDLLKGNPKITVKRNIVWALSNLLRGKPKPPTERVSVAIPWLINMLNDTDEEILQDACWAISYYSDGPANHIKFLTDNNVVPRLIELMVYPSYSVQTPALRSIGKKFIVVADVEGNIATGDDAQTQVLLESGLLNVLGTLLRSPKKGIRKEAAWTLSNITAGDKRQIQLVIEANLVPTVLEMMGSGEYDVRKESAWVIGNALCGASDAQLVYLCNLPLVESLAGFLKGTTEPKSIILILVAFQKILAYGEKSLKGPDGVNQCTMWIENSGALDLIEELQSHQSDEVYKLCQSILKTHFDAEFEDSNNSTATSTNMVIEEFQ